MLNNVISKWDGTVKVNGNQVAANFNVDSVTGPIKIMLYPNKSIDVPTKETKDSGVNATGTYRITVKSYMTKKATPEFDFMAKFNKNIPMPLLTMVGEKVPEKETKGMWYMKLHGDITSTITQTCMRCGKPITNEVSRFFGLGPVCGQHNYTNPFSTEEELKSAVGEYRKKLQQMTWEGYVIKSAVIEEVKLKD